MFYFLLFIIILVMTYLFYIKFFKKVESFTFEGNNPYADDKAMLVDIVDNYYYYKKPVVFEHNNHTCVFSQSNPIEKQFKRVVLPDNYNEILESSMNMKMWTQRFIKMIDILRLQMTSITPC